MPSMRAEIFLSFVMLNVHSLLNLSVTRNRSEFNKVEGKVIEALL